MPVGHVPPAMAGPIQKIPGGLLDFFQLKNSGRNPHELPSVLQPVLAMEQWYWQTYSEIVGGTDAAIAGVAPVDKITVPDNEFWVVHEVQVDATLAAASVVIIVPYFRQGPAGSVNNYPFNLAEMDVWDAATAGTTYLRRMTHQAPLLLIPGSILGLRAPRLSAATTTGNLFARITRMKA